MRRGSRAGPGPTVLYIAGWSRSGSTLLDQLLGQADGWFSCGELRLLPMNFACGCGSPVQDCPLWREVLGEALPQHSLGDLDAVAELRRRAVGTGMRTVAAIARPHWRPGPKVPAPRAYADFLSDLYRAIARATGARVLVDSSKMVAEPYLLGAFADVDVRVAHLVRDPRASAYSWGRRKPSFTPRAYLPTMGPAQSSFNWVRRNLAIEAVLRPRQRGRYLRVRYEDFTDRPQAFVQSLCSLAGDPAAELPFHDQRAIRLGPNHMAAGNPVRFAQGEVAIRPDNAWRTRMDARSKALATLPALPLMRRYGYDID